MILLAKSDHLEEMPDRKCQILPQAILAFSVIIRPYISISFGFQGSGMSTQIDSVVEV